MYFPLTADEAFDTFTRLLDDNPEDCHNHCKCYETQGKCCDCGDKKGPVGAVEVEVVPILDREDFGYEELASLADEGPWV